MMLAAREVGLRDGGVVLLRSPEEADVERLLGYLDRVRQETDNLLFSPLDPLPSVEEERQWVRRSLEGPRSLTVVAERGDELVACCGVEGFDNVRRAHVVNLGISVLAAWRGLGLGRVLMETLIDWCRAHDEVTVVQLGALADNLRACGLYRSLGFVDEGRRVRAYCRETTGYVDELLMSLWVGEGVGASAGVGSE
ncbi:GNAT family N-acetyltransferase [Mucisphaera calidilacus]|uniref:Putative acetyltransferase YhhY n=1 Tax=Mucisphaera calidilacus TaxID=2527982 RepID=A0A518BTX3_9BACT|nr:GNAT family N-acetyltransferase [Mucisphaera calidilacus]QDU70423.1 putative acetyltransferase YhhY [Mucisphaera calidilacus]